MTDKQLEEFLKDKTEQRMTISVFDPTDGFTEYTFDAIIRAPLMPVNSGPRFVHINDIEILESNVPTPWFDDIMYVIQTADMSYDNLEKMIWVHRPVNCFLVRFIEVKDDKLYGNLNMYTVSEVLKNSRANTITGLLYRGKHLINMTGMPLHIHLDNGVVLSLDQAEDPRAYLFDNNHIPIYTWCRRQDLKDLGHLTKNSYMIYIPDANNRHIKESDFHLEC